MLERVRALLNGRAELARLAPHLARPAPFLLPLQGHAWKARAGLRLYSALARDGSLQSMDRVAAIAAEPMLDGQPFSRALLYQELATHDARLVVEMALGAAEAGATLLTRVDCVELRDDGHGNSEKANGGAGALARLALRDRLTNQRLEARAKVVVNATGPWCDGLMGATRARSVDRTARRRPAVRLSRGTHIVLAPRRLPLKHTVVLFSPRDGRALFASPRDGFVLIGTTENEHIGPVGTSAPSAADVDYLLEAAQNTFPGARLRPRDVAATFTGVRPLLRREGMRDPGSLDRGYSVDWDGPRLLTVRGGKLTLALHGARKIMAAIGRRAGALGIPRAATAPFRLPVLPGARPPISTEPRGLRASLPPATITRLERIYGGRATLLLPFLRAPGGSLPLTEGVPVLRAEWDMAHHLEEALTFEDFSRRRSDLSLLAAVCRHESRERSPQTASNEISVSVPFAHQQPSGRAA